MTVLTTLTPRHHNHEKLRLEKKYADWIATRNVEKVNIVELETGITDLEFRGRIFRIFNLSYRSDDTFNSLQQADYLFLSEQFKDDAVSTARLLKADTVLLSPAIDRRRRMRMMLELTSDSIPAIDLSDNTFTIVES